MREIRAAAVTLGVLATALACSRESVFNCADATDCQQDGQPGTCEPDGLCSFPDAMCPSGRRYGRNAGSRSNDCVPGSGTTSSGSGSSTATTIGECAPDEQRCGDACVVLDTDPNHCGACDVVCQGTPTQDPICVGGSCSLGCETGTAMVAGQFGCFPCAPMAVLDALPVAYWRFGESSPTDGAVDASGMGNDGEYQTVTVGAPGIAPDGDTAATFGASPGTAMAVQQFDMMPTNAFTVVMWLRTESMAPNMGLYSYATMTAADEFLITGADEIDVWFNDGRVLSINETLSDGAWHQLAVAVEDLTIQVYVDAQLSIAAAGGTVEAGGFLIIGQDQDVPGGGFVVAEAFVGDLDEIAVFDRALTADEIRAQFDLMLCQ